MNDETNKIDAEFDAAWGRVGRHSPEERKRLESAPTIRIGSRWRNKLAIIPGAMFLLDAETVGKTIYVGLFAHPKGLQGFAWFGNREELLQQWEPIEP